MSFLWRVKEKRRNKIHLLHLRTVYEHEVCEGNNSKQNLDQPNSDGFFLNTFSVCPQVLPFGSPNPSVSPWTTSDLLPACVWSVPDQSVLSSPIPENFQPVDIKTGGVRNQADGAQRTTDSQHNNTSSLTLSICCSSRTFAFTSMLALSSCA